MLSPLKHILTKENKDYVLSAASNCDPQIQMINYTPLQTRIKHICPRIGNVNVINRFFCVNIDSFVNLF